MTAKTRRKAKKNLLKKKKQILLDTSIQIKKFVNSELDELINSSKKDSIIASSFFVLYEFKTGFICSLIEFYLFIQTSNKTISDAIGDWSNSFKIRKLKNKIILEAVMLKIFGSIDATSKEKYLSQVEALILYFITNFDTALDKMTGSFENDKIVQHKIFSKNDYKSFLNNYKSRECIPLDKFWGDNITSLDKFLAQETEFNKLGYKKFYDKLSKIKDNFINANMPTINKGVGDAVITVDCSNKYTIYTIDALFEVLCRCVDKNLNLINIK
jgi:hypothetical protein